MTPVEQYLAEVQARLKSPGTPSLEDAIEDRVDIALLLRIVARLRAVLNEQGVSHKGDIQEAKHLGNSVQVVIAEVHLGRILAALAYDGRD